MHCRQCNTTKDVTDFYASNKSRCKECIKASALEYRLANLDRIRAYESWRDYSSPFAALMGRQ